MHLKFRNVNDAFRSLVEAFHTGTIPTVRTSSRNGDVLQIPEPVIITYEKPKERVLFNQARDASPVFHLYESLHMLSGRNDIEPLAYYAANMRNYSDDGKTQNGAYGYRWRQKQVVDQYCDASPGDIPWTTVDQLDILVAHLKADPNSRRAVLQMWNVEDDLLKIGNTREYADFEDYNNQPSEVASKDVCCNLSVMFSLRDVYEYGYNGDLTDYSYKVLDMTVTNRSNDLVWGALGANAVHFSILQEYMAARIGVEVGRYNQFTNNLHVYQNDVWKPEAFLRDGTPDFYSIEVNGFPKSQRPEEGYNSDYCYEWEPGRYVPLVKNPEVFEAELKSIVGNGYGGGVCSTVGVMTYLEPFFETVAKPMFCAFECYKKKEWEYAFEWVNAIGASDWKMAAKNWIAKRYAKRKGAADVPAGTE